MKKIIYLGLIATFVGCANSNVSKLHRPQKQNVIIEENKNISPLAIYYFQNAETANLSGRYEVASSLYKRCIELEKDNIFLYEKYLSVLDNLATQSKETTYNTQLMNNGLKFIEDKKISLKILELTAKALSKDGQKKKAKEILKLGLDLNPDYYYYLQYFLLDEELSSHPDISYLEKSYDLSLDNEQVLGAIASKMMKYDKEKAEEMFLDIYNRFQSEKAIASLLLFYLENKDYENFEEYVTDSINKNLKISESFLEQYFLLELVGKKDYKRIYSFKDLIPNLENLKLRRLILESSLHLEEWDTAKKIIMHELQNPLDKNDKNNLLLVLSNIYCEEGMLHEAAPFIAEIDSYENVLKDILVRKMFQIYSELGEKGFDKNMTFISELEKTNINAQLLTLYKLKVFTLYAKDDLIQKQIENLDLEELEKIGLVKTAAISILTATDDRDFALDFLKKSNIPEYEVYETIGVYYYLIDYSISKIYLEKALSLNKNIQPDSYGALAAIYESEDDVQSQIDLLKEAVKIYPESASLLNWLGYTLLINNQEIEYAGELIQKAVKLDSENVSIWDSLAWYYYKIGDFEKAKETMKQVVQEDMRDSTVYYHLGEILYKTADFQKSKFYFQKAIDLNTNEDAVKSASEALNNYFKEK